MKNNLTFEMLPSAIQEMNNRLIRMERLLNSKSEKFDSEQWFDLDKLIEYLPDHPAKQTIYGTA